MMYSFLLDASYSQPCSRWSLIKVLLSVEKGEHVNIPQTEFFRCVAFRLEPSSNGSFNDVDGEVVEAGRIQGRVVPRNINFLA